MWVPTWDEVWRLLALFAGVVGVLLVAAALVGAFWREWLLEERDKPPAE
jgi:hypothetical protein